MGKKKDKSKKGKGAEKTALKTERNAEKKVKKMLKAKGEENIEALIAEYQEQGRKLVHVVEERCEQPSPRSNSTLTPHPDKDELILLGGEFFSGNKTVMYNDMFVYSVKNNTWTLLKVPGSPPPRSSHQAVAVKQAGGQLWVFGGEFASPTQSQYFHYKDLWVFHFHSKKWEKVSVPGGPSARSGHRMVVCKRQIFVFGGFHDNLRGDYKYFNDVHMFDLDTYTWTQIQPSGNLPPPRSGCCMAVTQDEKNIVIFGGYSKAPVKKDIDKGHVHTDMYMLSIGSTAGQSKDGKEVKWKWTQIKQSGARPSPRCSCAVVATPGNRALFFGGVVDDEDDEDLESKFYNDMYTVELDKGKWHEVVVRGKKEAKERKKRRRKKDGKNDDDESDQEKCDTDDDIEDDVDRLTVTENSTSAVENSAVMDQSTSSSNAGDSVFTVSIGPQSSQTDSRTNKTGATKGAETEQFWPCPRMNAHLAVRNGVLYLYGGMYEEGDKQLTLQDMYSLDLHKLDEWKTLIKNEADKLVWEASDSSGESDDDSEDDEDDEDEEGMDTGEAPALNKDESLNDYFSRSKDYWLDKADEVATAEGLTVTMKQLKKAAFKMAEEFVKESSAKS